MVDACHTRVIHLPVLQVDHIWVELVHIASSSFVQAGVSFSVVRVVSFSVA
jgi:hypothetical protein